MSPSASAPPPLSVAPSALQRILQLCLLGITSAPAPTLAGDLLLAGGPGPDIPRCTPQAPRSGITVTAPQLSAAPLDGPVADLALPSQGILWVVGTRGQIQYRAYPSGPWTPYPADTRADLYAIDASYLSPQPWVVGANGTALHYGSSGWQTVDLPTRADLLDVLFWGYTQGAIVGADGTFLLTLDEGQTWTALRVPGRGRLTRLAASPGSPSRPTVLALRDDGAVLVASPQDDTPGAPWSVAVRPVPGAALPLRDILAWSPEALLVVDAAGALWSTRDGGLTWQSSPSASPLTPLRAVVQLQIGTVGVQESGHLQSVSSVSPDAPPLLSPLVLAADDDSTQTRTRAKTMAPPPGLVLAHAAAGGSGGQLVGLTADGQLMEQTLQPWFEPGHPCGRPFEIGQQSRCAPPTPRTDWATPADADADALAALSPALRQALAAAWLRDAQAEHASVASFARFSLRLLALGAPAALVADAQQAMGDEIRHAQRCFALAARYAGAPRGPGPLAIDGALDAESDLYTVSVEVLREGAVGETIGAVLAAEMLAHAQDPLVRAALSEIAADEARHAQMAWRFLRWAIDQGGEDLRQHLRAALDAALRDWTPAAASAPADAVEGLWAAHGRLSPRAERRAIRRCLRQVVRPCAARLLDSGDGAVG